jgi:hypothetical protein
MVARALAIAFDQASWRGADLVAVHTWLEFSSDSNYAYVRDDFGPPRRLTFAHHGCASRTVA